MNFRGNQATVQIPVTTDKPFKFWQEFFQLIADLSPDEYKMKLPDTQQWLLVICYILL